MTIRKTFAGLCTLSRSFALSKKGGVALIFAFTLAPLLLIIGVAVQYSWALSLQVKLNAFGDEVALGAVSTTAIAALASQSDNGQAQALAQFNVLASTISGASINSVTVNIAKSSSSLTATISYTASVSSVLNGLIGNVFVQIAGTSVATAPLPVYSNFYLLLDGSPSMGIGASQSDINAMQTANNGCGFACHSPRAYSGAYPGYSLPNVPGTQLRIDVLRSATVQLISTAIARETVSDQFKIGVYTFDNDVTTLTNLTGDLASARTLTNSIALPTTDVGTQIGDAINWLDKNKVGWSGSGTAASPINYVFIVTDGVEDQVFNYIPGAYDNLASPHGTWNGQNVAGALNPAACANLKAKGVTIAVLYTNYFPLSDIRYTDMVQPYAQNIATALQSCASPNFFFQANYASDINTAMQTMFARALSKSARLTQ